MKLWQGLVGTFARGPRLRVYKLTCIPYHPLNTPISGIRFDEKLDMRVEGRWEDMVALIGKEKISLT